MIYVFKQNQKNMGGFLSASTYIRDKIPILKHEEETKSPIFEIKLY